MRVLRVRKGARTHSDELLTWMQVLSVGTPVALAKKTWLIVNAGQRATIQVLPTNVYTASIGFITIAVGKFSRISLSILRKLIEDYLVKVKSKFVR